MSSKWKLYLSDKKNRSNFIFTIILLSIVLISLPPFLSFIELRDGFSFSDPILRLFRPMDLTWFTFSLIYIGLITALITLSHYPKFLLLALKVYAITGILRICGMYLLPLAPPDSMIQLNDPFVQFWGSGDILTKDLFFSGHTSTVFIFFLTAQTKIMKRIFLIATVLVAFCVIVQHVHYSIDVFAAPFFAYAALRAAKWIDNVFEW